MKCGSCLQGCPTNAGKNTMNTYIHKAWARGCLKLGPTAPVERIVMKDRGSTGSRPPAWSTSTRAGQAPRRWRRAPWWWQAGTLNTPQILLRSGIRELAGGSPSKHAGGSQPRLPPLPASSTACSTRSRTRTSVYPISSHCMKHQLDEDGGFTRRGGDRAGPDRLPASALSDENGPLWAGRSVDAAKLPLLDRRADDGQRRQQRPGGGDRGRAASASPSDFRAPSRGWARAGRSPRTCRRRRGEADRCGRDRSHTHLQGSCRMGSDPGTLAR